MIKLRETISVNIQVITQILNLNLFRTLAYEFQPRILWKVLPLYYIFDIKNGSIKMLPNFL